MTTSHLKMEVESTPRTLCISDIHQATDSVEHSIPVVLIVCLHSVWCIVLAVRLELHWLLSIAFPMVRVSVSSGLWVSVCKYLEGVGGYSVEGKHRFDFDRREVIDSIHKYWPGLSSAALEGMWKLWCGWWQREREGNIHCSECKHWPSLPLLRLWSLHADFLQYLSGITKWEYNSWRADSVHITEHRLFVACFSPQRPGFAPRAVQISTYSIATIKRDRSLIYKI
jgi:hypothetical protein